ncbi:RNA-binding protein 41-like isoform X1 [Hippocampus zosterae]|uniref:RNA-binding protein 41-like isoform X1 n=1 Tax=Hippocampus zosterae TaxID=109293 RepID=UPI00223E8B08|nr:RNA-binding protein 41-like isoform X1 [Hippocampus zosterae]
MRQRVSRRSCEDGPLLEEQETEGQRQLHGLLLRQLHTQVDVERCVAKKRSFAPAALYHPFGEQVSGVRSLSQFQTLQEDEQELAGLRELGLTDPEIQLWQNRDAPEVSEQCHGICAAPDVKRQRLQAIRDKIAARAELLARPQRFAASRPLSRREMEIEQALFQGSDRQGFLAALYHRDENNQDGLQGATPTDPMDSLYRDLLSKSPQGVKAAQTLSLSTSTPSHHSRQGGDSQSEEGSPEPPEHHPAAPLEISRPIGSLRGAEGAGSGRPLTVTGRVPTVTDQEIRENRESQEGIRSIPRFRNYQPGKPSRVVCVKNLSPHASVAQLVALFSRFEGAGDRPPLLYRLLTGRMKGQAFVTLPDTKTAQDALQLLHGYRLLGKPLVLEFGRERTEADQREART